MAASKPVGEFRENALVWAKMRGYPHWPAKVIKPPRGQKMIPNKVYVFFYGTHQTAWMPLGDLCDYIEGQARFRQPLKMKGFMEAIWEIEEDPSLKISMAMKPLPKKKTPAKVKKESTGMAPASPPSDSAESHATSKQGGRKRKLTSGDSSPSGKREKSEDSAPCSMLEPAAFLAPKETVKLLATPPSGRRRGRPRSASKNRESAPSEAEVHTSAVPSAQTSRETISPLSASEPRKTTSASSSEQRDEGNICRRTRSQRKLSVNRAPSPEVKREASSPEPPPLPACPAPTSPEVGSRPTASPDLPPPANILPPFSPPSHSHPSCSPSPIAHGYATRRRQTSEVGIVERLTQSYTSRHSPQSTARRRSARAPKTVDAAKDPNVTNQGCESPTFTSPTATTLVPTQYDTVASDNSPIIDPPQTHITLKTGQTQTLGPKSTSIRTSLRLSGQRAAADMSPAGQGKDSVESTARRGKHAAISISSLLRAPLTRTATMPTVAPDANPSPILTSPPPVKSSVGESDSSTGVSNTFEHHTERGTAAQLARARHKHSTVSELSMDVEQSAVVGRGPTPDDCPAASTDRCRTVDSSPGAASHPDSESPLSGILLGAMSSLFAAEPTVCQPATILPVVSARRVSDEESIAGSAQSQLWSRIGLCSGASEVQCATVSDSHRLGDVEAGLPEGVEVCNGEAMSGDGVEVCKGEAVSGDGVEVCKGEAVSGDGVEVCESAAVSGDGVEVCRSEDGEGMEVCDGGAVSGEEMEVEEAMHSVATGDRSGGGAVTCGSVGVAECDVEVDTVKSDAVKCDGVESGAVMGDSVKSDAAMGDCVVVMGDCVKSDAVMGDSVKSDAVKSDAAVSDCVKSDAVMGDGVKSDTAMGDCVKSDAVMGDCVKSDAVMGDGVKRDAVMGDGVKNDTVKCDSAESDANTDTVMGDGVKSDAVKSDAVDGDANRVKSDAVDTASVKCDTVLVDSMKADDQVNPLPLIKVRRGMSTVQVLTCLNYNLKASLTIEAPDVPRALLVLKDVRQVSCGKEDLLQVPDLVQTVKKLCHYQPDEDVRRQAKDAVQKLKDLFLQSPAKLQAAKVVGGARRKPLIAPRRLSSSNPHLAGKRVVSSGGGARIKNAGQQLSNDKLDRLEKENKEDGASSVVEERGEEEGRKKEVEEKGERGEGRKKGAGEKGERGDGTKEGVEKANRDTKEPETSMSSACETAAVQSGAVQSVAGEGESRASVVPEQSPLRRSGRRSHRIDYSGMLGSESSEGEADQTVPS